MKIKIPAKIPIEANIAKNGFFGSGRGGGRYIPAFINSLYETSTFNLCFIIEKYIDTCM